MHNMKTTIGKGKLYLGKCDYTGSGRKNCAAYITWELEESANGPEFSAQAEIWNPRKTDIYMGGQCLEEVLELFRGSAKGKRIMEVWKRYHLNGMNAGLPAQTAAIREWEAKGNRYEYGAVCAMLKAAGLYELPLPEGVKATGGFPLEVVNGTRGYRYGEGWVYASIPDEVIEEIKSWTLEPVRA